MPDPLVQDPASTQNFNRYSYCLNNLTGVYAKRADLHTSGWFLEGLYAEWPVLHTRGGISSSLYAESPILHTGRGEQGSRTEVRVG